MLRLRKKQKSFITTFLKMEASGGILLFVAAILAVIMANSPLQGFYQWFLSIPVEIRIGALQVDKPLLLWINDGLMALFFFLVGLELKRELVEGELSDKRNIILPGVGALGGMLLPALIYTYFNYGDPNTIDGWAIPAATDIAFALGVLTLLGSKVPTSIKIFLTSLAIFDDIGAIIIIAIFYTSKISFVALSVVLLCVPILYILNRRNVLSKSVYFLIGVIMWTAMLKSGFHATLTGVLLAMFIPMRSKTDPSHSPVARIENDLHTLVAFIVLPVFAFSNSGISLTGFSLDQVTQGVPLGIILGLFIGKQVGIFSFCWLFIKLNLAKLPNNVSFLSLYGTAILCGIGFTMSLFIGSLAFQDAGVNVYGERLGIIVGSILSGIFGYFVLKYSLRKVLE